MPSQLLLFLRCRSPSEPARHGMHESLGSKLRYERERRKIDLNSIAEATKISVGLLQGLERDDVKRWPSGIFRKSFIKSYAAAVGLDPEVVLKEFMDAF